MTVLYSEKKQKEIINKFQALLKKADNFPRDQDPSDYKVFWVALRGEGANLLGLTNYLLSMLEIIDSLPKEKIDIEND